MTKALARHGLGLYIYAGDDLPEIEVEKISPSDARILKDSLVFYENPEELYQQILIKFRIKNFKELTCKQYCEVLEGLKAMPPKVHETQPEPHIQNAEIAV